MEFTILDVYESQGSLTVEVEHEYGKQKLGLGLHTKYLDPATGQPRFISETKELLEKRFGDRNKDKSIKKTKVFKEFVGKKFKIGEK